jgi:hypothetical protein
VGLAPTARLPLLSRPEDVVLPDFEFIRRRLDETMAAGCGLIAGLVGGDGRPRATRAWSVEITGDAHEPTVRTLVSADDPDDRRALDTGWLALTGAEVRTLRSMQMKGPIVAVGSPSDADLALAEAHTAWFFRAVEAIDHVAPAHLEAMLPDAMVAVEFRLAEIYEQTPGPGAGAPLPSGANGGLA